MCDIMKAPANTIVHRALLETVAEFADKIDPTDVSNVYLLLSLGVYHDEHLVALDGISGTIHTTMVKSGSTPISSSLIINPCESCIMILGLRRVNDGTRHLYMIPSTMMQEAKNG